MSFPRLPFLFRPYLARELPGWGRLSALLGIEGVDNASDRWREAPTRTVRGSRHGYLMSLDLRDDNMRMIYFVGRHYDLNMQVAIDRVVSPGDTFVDIGANIGMTTLHAARRVGPTGRVIAFEPQPACCDYIRKAIEANGITHIELHNAGLAAAPGELTLNVIGGGTIMATFTPAAEGVRVRETIKCKVLVGDEVLAGRVVGNLVIKIDVEGFELQCLRGLTATIDTHRPAVFTEVEPDHLRRAGSSAEELFEFFHSRGYRALDVRIARRGLRWGSALTPVRTQSEMKSTDALWIPAEKAFDPVHFPPARPA